MTDARGRVSSRIFWLLAFAFTVMCLLNTYHRTQAGLWQAEAEYATALAIECVNAYHVSP